MPMVAARSLPYEWQRTTGRMSNNYLLVRKTPFASPQLRTSCAPFPVEVFYLNPSSYALHCRRSQETRRCAPAIHTSALEDHIHPCCSDPHPEDMTHPNPSSICYAYHVLSTRQGTLYFLVHVSFAMLVV
ncbi:hypothetical protein OH76DRAFT_1403552, partial [Lentinus brumalis]